MSVALSDLIQMLQLPPGRRLQAQLQVAEIAAAAAAKSDKSDKSDKTLKRLADHCQQAMEHEQTLLHMLRQLSQAANAPTSPELTALDPQIDRVVGAIFRVADEHRVALPGAATAAHAERMCHEAFPQGVFPIVSKNYVEQCAEVESLVALFEGDLAGAVRALHLDVYVTELKRLNQTFRKHLDRAPQPKLTADQVRGENARGQQYVLTTVAMVLGRFPTQSDDDVQGRSRFLAPILTQQKAVQGYFKARRRVRDVDPDTGTELPAAEQPTIEPSADHPNTPTVG